MGRWQRVELIKQLADEEGKFDTINNEDRKLIDEIKQFKRTMRITTLRQKENYQKEIDRLFNILIHNLMKEFEGEVDTRENEELYTLDYLIEKERNIWLEKKKKIKTN